MNSSLNFSVELGPVIVNDGFIKEILIESDTLGMILVRNSSYGAMETVFQLSDFFSYNASSNALKLEFESLKEIQGKAGNHTLTVKLIDS